ncbi:MAG: WG repeat-containing protein [Acidobacteriota bacterium]|nr:WG repeat-containing protein [Acidobacteriota bacterium]
MARIRRWGQPRPFHEGIAAILIWGVNGARNTSAFINQSGHVVLSGGAANWQASFSGGLMPLADGARWGFVDKSFRWAIAPKYDGAEEFSDGLAPVQVGRKWGYIDKTGNQIVSPAYDQAWEFSDGRGRVEIDFPTGKKSMTMEGPQPVYRREFGFVDANGAEAIRPQFESATNFQQGRAFVILPGSR